MERWRSGRTMTKPKLRNTGGQTERVPNTLLRAVAILCVLLIHTLSSIQPSPFYADSGIWQWVAVGLDQAARISVPLFVALSGYGLWIKYGSTLDPVGVPRFWFRRLSKLLPAYLLWSVVFGIVFLIFPTWTTRETLPSFPWQLVWGRADYHLYFVPMIVQLYLLFPVFAWVQRRWPLALATAALLLQLTWYAYYSYGGNVPLELVFFRGDSEQYLWSPNWIWYFVLGMQLPTILARTRGTLWQGILLIATCIAWVWLVWLAVTTINSGTDPLIALKFTRFEVMAFATLAIPTAWIVAGKFRRLPPMLQWLGDWSYHIYLSHTLVLRLIFNILLR